MPRLGWRIEGRVPRAGSEALKIQFNTDNHIDGNDALESRVNAMLEQHLGRFFPRLSRLEVFLSDSNSTKGGPDDKRCALEARLQAIVAGRERGRAGLLILDIDRFKAINDDFGHAAGDTVLIALSAALHEERRQGDSVYRFGGEEFVVALRDTRLAMMDRRTFVWLFENSVGFNRFLVGSLNERLGQFIALLEYGRTLDATARLARSIASLFNPILYPELTLHLEITQEEIGALSGISRQNANQCLKRLEREGLLRLEYGGVTIIELDRLRHYGE